MERLLFQWKFEGKGMACQWGEGPQFSYVSIASFVQFSQKPFRNSLQAGLKSKE